MTEEVESEFEIAHVLCTDIVGYSKLMIDQQADQLRTLNEVIRRTDQFQRLSIGGKLLRIPTGDGVVLVFFTHPQDPAECAVQIAKSLKAHPEIELRMGLHSGPVNRIPDVNEQSNVAGAGINIAQRVMDCGDAGHILLSKRIGEDLAHYSKWRPHLHELGEFEVKHGIKIDIVNLSTDEVGNPAVPQKLKKEKAPAAPVARLAKLLIAATLIVAVAAAGVWFSLHRGEKSSTGPPLAAIFPGKSVAVLPFKPLVAANRDEVLEAGMADTLIAKLSTSREMIVPSLASARKYDDQTHDSGATGRALRVNSVLEGNLQKSGDRIRVTARLIRVSDGRSMWSGTFDEKFTDVFQVEDAIAEKVAAALQLQLSDEDRQRLTKRYTENTEAYQLYLKGRFYWNKYTEEGWRKSIEFFKEAAAKDPNYALAYAGIADSYSLLGEVGIIAPKEIFPRARTYAEKALKLDDNLSEAHLSLGIVKLFYDWNPPAAEPELARARELNPSDPQVHHFYGHYLEFASRLPEATAELKRGVDLDPTNLIVNAEYGYTFYIRRQYDEAIARYRKTLELDPNFVLASVWIAQALEQKGMYPEALAELQRAQKIENWYWLTVEIGCVNALTGKRDEAQKIIAELNDRSAHEYIDETLIAYIWVALGAYDQAFAWLEKGYQSRAGNLPWMVMEPKFDPIRSDPRFDELVRRMGLK